MHHSPMAATLRATGNLTYLKIDTHSNPRHVFRAFRTSSIGKSAFIGIGTSLTAVIFLGNAPKAEGPLVFLFATPTIYRKPEAKGWGETFGGRPVKLISEKPAPPLED